jgi:predicted TIM-barrel fold metal-dependent hydrolase
MTSSSPNRTRREFIAAGSAFLALSALSRTKLIAGESAASEPIIDIHQHVPYSDRRGEALISHQRALGITTTILLPAGSRFGLAAGVAPYPEAKALAETHPDLFRWFANEVSDQPGAIAGMRRQLEAGAIGIGEQKFDIDSDSPALQRVAELAEEFGVPVLMHFQQGRYNHHFERFHHVLEKHPRVNFIGHAQTFWGHVAQGYEESDLFPKGPVKAGGLTDRLLADYPNLYGDVSAGSGFNALNRDEDHARAFIARHQDKLLFGSDCSDFPGSGRQCHGAHLLAAIRRLAPDKPAERKILFHNARRILKLNR